MELHAELDDVFLLHQEALMELDFELAGDALAAYVRLLTTHMRHEETWILPIFDRAGPVPRWPRVLYTGQHEKMRGMLESAGNRVVSLRKLPTTPRRDRRRAALVLLAEEATYTHLCEHHDGAERDGLYPVVDRVATPDEHVQLLARCRKEWGQALELERPLLDRIRQELD
jgi:hypothetical protein